MIRPVGDYFKTKFITNGKVLDAWWWRENEEFPVANIFQYGYPTARQSGNIDEVIYRITINQIRALMEAAYCDDESNYLILDGKSSGSSGLIVVMTHDDHWRVIEKLSTEEEPMFTLARYLASQRRPCFHS